MGIIRRRALRAIDVGYHAKNNPVSMKVDSQAGAARSDILRAPIKVRTPARSSRGAHLQKTGAGNRLRLEQTDAVQPRCSRQRHMPSRPPRRTQVIPGYSATAAVFAQLLNARIVIAQSLNSGDTGPAPCNNGDAGICFAWT